MPPVSPEEAIQDDRGNSFPKESLAPLPLELKQSITARPLADAHMLLLFGMFSLVTLYIAGPVPSSSSYTVHNRAGRFLLFGIASVVTAIARYAGVGPGRRTDRRLLLKRALCPVCLQPLDQHHAHGETIECSCGAIWERRYM